MVQASNENNARKLKQLKSIMALATDPRTPDAEAQAALESAQRLMATYGLSLDDLHEDGGQLSRSGNVETWDSFVSNKHFAGVMRRDAFNAIANAFGARMVCRRRRTRGGNTKGWVLEFYATTSVMETLRVFVPALMAYAENRQAAELAEKRAELKADESLSDRDRQREADQWVKGWWVAFGASTADKIRRTRKGAMDEYLGSGKGEMVRQSDADRAQAYINSKYKGDLATSRSGRTAYGADALRKGRQAGRDALVGQDEVKKNGEQRRSIS